ncbi:MAG TPA: BON domain-containing protein [Thiobacillus sp.]|nr:BON domain-containing protein [Thiobacillus sp.]
MKSINPRFLSLTLAGLLSAASASALAQSMPGATPGAPSVKTYDSNGDGEISIEEFKPQGGQEQARDKRLNSDEYAKAGNYVDDAWITAKVKALLLKDEGVKGLDVNVETHKGIVQLAGWVNSPAQIAQAETIARSVEGVKGVSNDLQVKR